MTEKSEKKVLSRRNTPAKTKVDKSPPPAEQAKRRGRPPGAKNKPKDSAKPELSKILKEAGLSRQRVSKLGVTARKALETRARNVIARSSKKPRKASAKPAAPVADKTPAQVAEEALHSHILYKAADWVSKNMHKAEVQYYRSAANKRGLPMVHAIVSDIIGFFNIQDEALNKLVKKNKSIINYSNGIHTENSELS